MYEIALKWFATDVCYKSKVAWYCRVDSACVVGQIRYSNRRINPVVFMTQIIRRNVICDKYYGC